MPYSLRTSHRVRVAQVAQATTFPLSVAAGSRFLQTASGAPFFLAQDAGWSAPFKLTATEQAQYLDDRQSRGFTGAITNAIDTTTTSDTSGNRCFSTQLNGSAWNGVYDFSQNNTTQPDFTTASAAYFATVANYVAIAKARGILLILAAAYLGFNGGSEGWMTAMVQNDAVTGAGGFAGQPWANGAKSKMWNYGAYIGNLLSGYNNILWVLGGDYFPSVGAQQTAVQSYLQGVQSAAGASTLWTGHWNSPSISTDETPFASSMNANGCYAFDGTMLAEGRAGFSYSPTIPAYPLEFPYEGESGLNPAATEPIRRYAWWGWLSAVGGAGFGNGSIWPFNSGWASSLNSQGAQDFARLISFAQRISWQKLLPSGLGGAGTLITSNGGTIGGSTSNYISAAVTSDGAYLVAYVPPASSGAFSVAVSSMRGPWTAQWYDPTNAAFTSAGSGTNSGSQSFTPPGTNAQGIYTDQVLLIAA